MASMEIETSQESGALASVRPQFRALVEAFVPRAVSLDAYGWASLLGVVEDALADRPADLRRQLLLFVRLLDWVPVIRHGRRLRSISVERRRSLLGRLQDAPILAVRRGVWGLRTLSYMGYYGRPDSYGEIGYRAHPDGWEARDRPAPWAAGS